MYSGTTFRRKSGRIAGVHQKIDRVARRNLSLFIKKSDHFPGVRQILYFEGKNGPDGLKFKGSKNDDPWHFIDPVDPENRALLKVIDDHIYNLSVAIRENNVVRAGFEAAWASHAIVDGLTPAHHYPWEEKVEQLHGKSRDQIQSLKDKAIIRGNSKRDTLSKNWQYYGAGGVLTGHLLYEMGVATAITTDRFSSQLLSEEDIIRLEKSGFDVFYLAALHKIHGKDFYNRFLKNGWTVDLAMETRQILLPEIIRLVALAWYCSIELSKGKTKNET